MAIKKQLLSVAIPTEFITMSKLKKELASFRKQSKSLIAKLNKERKTQYKSYEKTIKQLDREQTKQDRAFLKSIAKSKKDALLASYVIQHQREQRENYEQKRASIISENRKNLKNLSSKYSNHGKKLVKKQAESISIIAGIPFRKAAVIADRVLHENFNTSQIQQEFFNAKIVIKRNSKSTTYSKTLKSNLTTSQFTIFTDKNWTNGDALPSNDSVIPAVNKLLNNSLTNKKIQYSAEIFTEGTNQPIYISHSSKNFGGATDLISSGYDDIVSAIYNMTEYGIQNGKGSSIAAGDTVRGISILLTVWEY